MENIIKRKYLEILLNNKHVLQNAFFLFLKKKAKFIQQINWQLSLQR